MSTRMSCSQTRLNDAPNLPSGLYSASHSRKDFRWRIVRSTRIDSTESDSETKYARALRSISGFNRGTIPDLLAFDDDSSMLNLRAWPFYCQPSGHDLIARQASGDAKSIVTTESHAIARRSQLSRPQNGREADSEAIRVGDGEIAKTVVAIGYWNDDSRFRLLGQLPVVVHPRDHHSDVCRRKLRMGRLHPADPVKGGELGEKEPVIFPGQLHEVTSIAKHGEPQSTIELRGAPDVA